MRNKNRYNRYVTSNKIDGLFTVTTQDRKQKMARKFEIKSVITSMYLLHAKT